jgi:16S rRNA U1498 N3-methylase RsmE
MIEVKLNGWRPGLNKVALTKILQSHASLTLGEAKRSTDDLLAGKSVIVSVPDEETAERLIASATAIGASAVIQGPSTVRHVG